MIDKKMLQIAVDLAIKEDRYNEPLGQCILDFAETSVYKRGLVYRYSEFDVDFIIKPKIVDKLLLSIFRYDKAKATAYTFFSMITSNAIVEAIKDIRRAEKGESCGVFYIDDVKREVAKIESAEYEFVVGDVYIDRGMLMLK